MSETTREPAKRRRRAEDAPQAPSSEVCPTCDGSGLVNVAPDVTCTTCAGTGRAPQAEK